MALKVKSAEEISAKWGEVTPGRSTYYQEGAMAAGSDWETGTINASSAFKAAVTAGNIEALFKGGVKRAGAGKYTRKIEAVGVSRFGPGVAAAVSDMKEGVAPFVETMAALTLPARGPRGDPSNVNRVTAIMTANHKKRLALRAAGS